MKRYIYLIVIFSVIFFADIYNSYCTETTNDSVLMMKQKLDSLQVKICRVEHLVDLLKEAKDNVYKVHEDSIKSADRTYSIIQILLYFLIGILAAGFWGCVKTLRSVKKYVHDKAQEEAREEIKKAGSTVEERIKQLGIDKENLRRELIDIKKDIDSLYRLFQLQLSEDQQARAIANFIVKPVKDNPIIIFALSKLEESKNPNILAQSLLARHKCGDDTARGILKVMSKSKNKDIKEAAEEALKEIE